MELTMGLNRKLNIAIVCTGLHSLGGTVYHISNWLKYIDRNKFDVFFIYYSRKKKIIKEHLGEVKNLNLDKKIIFLNRESLFPILTIVRLCKIFKKLKIDIVHTVFLQSDIIGAIASKLAGVPVLISSVEGRLIPSPVNWIKWQLYRFGNKIVRSWFDVTIIVSQRLSQCLTSHGEINIEKVKIIPLGLSVSNTQRGKHSLDKVAIQKSKIGVIARLSKEKGVIHFIRSIPDILKFVPDAQFVIAGDGEEKDNLIRETEHLGLSNKIQFIGWVKDSFKIISDLDIIVVPSLEEGLPRIILEALLFGKPVIATNVGGIPELIKDNETGILIPSGDEKAISNAVIKLLKYPEKMVTLGQKGKIMVEQNFRVEQEVKKIEEIYSTYYNIRIKKRLLFIGSTPPPYGGMEMVTQTILKSELSNRFHILHLDTSDRRPTKDNAGKLEFINCYLGLKHLLQMFVLLRRRPDLVYLPIAQNNWGYFRDSMFLMLSKLFHRKIVVHLLGSYFKTFYTKTNFFMKFIVRYTLRNIECAIVLGDCLRYIFADFLSPEKIKVIPNGIDMKLSESITPSIQAKPIFSILFLGILSEQKGVLDILEAIPIVLEKRTDVKFVFVGEWLKDSYREAIKIIDKNELNEFIEFHGTIYSQGKINLLKNSDIFVFPPRQAEGQPLVILEAMAAGLPIITTDSGAIRETVIDGENGFIIEKQNPQHIAGKILLLLENADIRQKMGINSRKRFLENYTSEKFIANMKRVFGECLE